MNDCISREELRKHLKECYDNEFFNADMRKVTIGIDVYIENMPAADVQPVKRGKWNTHDVVKVLCSGKTLDGFCQCTACSDVFSLYYSYYNYCPNCGARMDLKDGDEE